MKKMVTKSLNVLVIDSNIVQFGNPLKKRKNEE